MKNIAIFASGSGTNTENLIRFFRTSRLGRVNLVLTNNPGAGVIDRARVLGIETVVFDRKTFYQTTEIPDILREKGTDLILLAGFLWLVPAPVLDQFRGRIINIHPALLPKYGGKGMFGKRVHEAVLTNGEPVSGITIHHVNPRYDEGAIIFQATCPVEPDDNADTLANRVHQLEYKHFPTVVEDLLQQM